MSETKLQVICMSGYGYARAQSLGRLELSRAIVRSRFIRLLLHCVSLATHLYLVADEFFCDKCMITSGNRMSPNMVACFAVEAISILEKLHLKGYLFLLL